MNSLSATADTTVFSAPRASRAALWTGRIMSGLPALFLIVDGLAKLAKPAAVIEGSGQLGFPESTLFGMGVVLLVSVAFYLVPRTAILGAILLTGFLGGAIATHVRVGNPLFTHTLFPVYFGVLLWGGLWLRDRRLRALFPLRHDIFPAA